MDWAKCPFEKAILSAQCTCELSTRRVVAERLNAGCRDASAAQDCVTLLELLKERARFTLRIADASPARLPFGKLMKVMVGGLRGLEGALYPVRAGATPIDNVHALVEEAKGRYGDLAALPFQDIIKAVAAHEPRRRR